MCALADIEVYHFLIVKIGPFLSNMSLNPAPDEICVSLIRHGPQHW
jgi:hypothetical protein